jgi:hypothetical protein
MQGSEVALDWAVACTAALIRDDNDVALARPGGQLWG